MNWNKDKSITLSRVFVVVFALALALLDVFCLWILYRLESRSDLPEALGQTGLVDRKSVV